MPLTRLIILSLVFSVAIGAASAIADTKHPDGNQIAFYTKVPHKKGNNAGAGKAKSRYSKPGFYGKSYPQTTHRGMTLIGFAPGTPGIPSNDVFFAKVKRAIDMIADRSPDVFRLMQATNPNGRRVIAYTGKIGPASFVAWNGDFVVNVTATNVDDDPVFENTTYSLAASLVHELVGHGRQEADGRLWAMYDWCGNDSSKVEGVLWLANHTGGNSGFVEYEANLFARWFLETVRGTYPNLIEAAVRRYVKMVRIMKKRFPGWYDERKNAVTLLAEFEGHFQGVCPGLSFTPHIPDSRQSLDSRMRGNDGG